MEDEWKFGAELYFWGASIGGQSADGSDIDVDVGLPAGAVAGDTITVSDGTTVTNIVLTAADITAATVSTTFPSPGDGNSITVTATLTDQAGNVSPSASDAATVDSSITPAPTVTITEDANNDGLISSAELSGDIDVDVGLPAGALAGDTITVTDGTTTNSIILTAADITAGTVSAIFPNPGDGNTISVTATLTDQAGNTSPSASDSATVDSSITPAPTVTITEDANDDGILEGKQHNTYDIDYYGANTMVGSLYLGALRAAEETLKRIEQDRSRAPVQLRPVLDDLKDLEGRLFHPDLSAESLLEGREVSAHSLAKLFTQELRQSLPAVEDVNTFLSSHQVAVAQLAIAYCDAFIGTNASPGPADSDPSFPAGFFSAPAGTSFSAANRGGFITPLVNRIMGTNLASQPAFADVNAELATFTAAGGRPNNLAQRLLDGGSNTRAIAKGVCAATLGNAATLIQ